MYDDLGISIMYDSALHDMQEMENYLLKLGTHYIKKNESDFDFEKFEFPFIDRIEVLHDLLDNEVDY